MFLNILLAVLTGAPAGEALPGTRELTMQGDLAAQMEVQQLEAAGVRVETSNDVAVRYVGRLLQSLSPATPRGPGISNPQSIDLAVLHQPLAAINVGLESFAESLTAQDAPVIQLDWQPPAGGDEKFMAILERMRHK